MGLGFLREVANLGGNFRVLEIGEVFLDFLLFGNERAAVGPGELQELLSGAFVAVVFGAENEKKFDLY